MPAGRPLGARRFHIDHEMEDAMRVKSIYERVRTNRQPPTDFVPLEQRVSLTEAEAAQYIGMSRAWLKKSRTTGGSTDAPPFVRCGRRRIAYRRTDLDAWQSRYLRVPGSRPTD
jgi:predicted DNA-binding transcriptional regulator AlpA